MSAAARPTPASLQASTATETPYGGFDLAWAEVATLWVRLSPAAPIVQLDGDRSAPAGADMATAVCADHPAAAAGQRLVVPGDAPWRVLRVDRALPAPSRMTLRLDRLT